MLLSTYYAFLVKKSYLFNFTFFILQPSNCSLQVRNMLDDMLEKNLEIVKTPCLNLVDPTETGGGIKLFKKAPPGISMDSMGM